MTRMTQTPAGSEIRPGSSRPVRDFADVYAQALAEHDPTVATALGLPIRQDELPDLTPAWQEAGDELARVTLAGLAELERQAGPAGFTDGDERRCARLLRERLETELAVSAAGENLRMVSNIFAPPQEVRGTFLMMPAATADDWAVIARRLRHVGAALAGYQASLAEGASRGLYAAPRQAATMAVQFGEWQQAGDGRGWFAGFAAGAPAAAPQALRSELAAAAADADAAVASLRDWLRGDYLPRAAGTPDGVGEDRYRTGVKRWNGATIDVAETYAWGWSQYREIVADMEAEADKLLPGSTPLEAMRHLDEHGEAVDGVEAIRERLQQLMDDAMANLDGTHFELADPIKVVEARIAPEGSAAAPYYTGPSQDFTRPGRTWLPTLGKTSFPLWGLISTWYHEGVPGHHLQLAQWRYLSSQLSVYQTAVGG